MKKSLKDSDGKRKCMATSSSSAYPAKMQQSSSSSCSPENIDEEEWVTVYGFSQKDLKLVLREFENCGWVVEHLTGSDAANWVHILYQNKNGAKNALSKNGMQIKEDVILGVKSVDSVQRQALNEERTKKLASKPIRQVVDPERLDRAFNQCIHLLHRSKADFFVLGETRNVYTVTLSRIPSCNCPDWITPCKHMLFVLCRVLRLSSDDDCLQRGTLKPCQVARLLNTPSSPETLAGARACERFRHLFSTMSNVGPPQKIQLENGQKCASCEGDLNEVDEFNAVVECEACGDVGHETCLVTSKWSSWKRAESICNSCREPWSAVPDETRYLNLAAYVSEDDEDEYTEDEG